MKIIDYTIKKKTYPTISIRGEILKDSEGDAILEAGRPVCKERKYRGARISYEFIFLVLTKGEPRWMRESDIVNQFGKKAYRNSFREFADKHGGKSKMISKLVGEV